MAREVAYQPKTALDVLRVPLVGRFLRWRYGRLVLQLFTLLIAAILLIDGFYGARFASGNTAAENLATIVSWVHYRGFVVLALLLVGNLFCMACPFALPRTLAHRLSISGRQFPRKLRNKWIAIAGLFSMFFLYEWLDLWASPLLTAWVIVAYFLASFVLEAVFTESAFCKYVCPLGTFNFVYSTVSPTQIGVKQLDICRTCVGKECINGSTTQTLITQDAIAVRQSGGVLGCGTALFPPQMTSNMDCTVCLDCVRACPHDNIGLFTRRPLAELTLPAAWRRRWDVTLLVVGLAFMGLTNAFGMVPPVYQLIDELAARLVFLRGLGWGSMAIEGVILLLIFGVGNLLLPLVVVLGLSGVNKRMLATHDSLREIAATFAPAFVPLGFGMWFAHYLFHFLVGVWAIIPATQSFLGMRPNYTSVGLSPNSIWLAGIEIGALLLGFAGSLYVAEMAARRRYGRKGMIALLPWAICFLLMMIAAIYIMGLPMEMRGVELFS